MTSFEKMAPVQNVASVHSMTPATSVQSMNPQASAGSAPLLVKYTNLKWTKADVTPVDSDVPLYSIEYKVRKPNLRFTRSGTGQPFGTSTFHFTTSRIDLELSGKTTELKTRRFLSMDYKYQSPAFGGQTMSWQSKSHFKDYDYVLLDERQIPVAKMVTVAGLSVKKIGKIEFAPDFPGGEAAREEVVATAVSLAYHFMLLMMAATAP